MARQKKLKYPKEVTEKAWATVFKCQQDKTKYNDHTQPVLSVQDALNVVFDAFPSFIATSHLKVENEDEAKFYYEVYRGLMLSTLRSLHRFNIHFTPIEEN